MLQPDTIYEKLVTLGDAWADSYAAAELLEETKKSVLAEIMTECNEKSTSAKETYALHSDRYIDHLEKMVSAKRSANRAKVKYDSAKVWAELKRTEAANLRATMKEAP